MKTEVLGRGAAAVLLALGLGVSLWAPATRGAASKPPAGATQVVTPPLKVEGKEVAVLAAGCFWSLEAIYEKVKGVDSVDSGYANGWVKDPTYQQVCNGDTGHAEAIRVVYDPKTVTYKELVEILLTIKDPTTLNRQGPDVGSQYRSAILYQNEAQKEVAQRVVQDFQRRKVWTNPLVVGVEAGKSFYPAEEYHLDYFQKNPGNGYSCAAIAPKLKELAVKFPALVKPEAGKE